MPGRCKNCGTDNPDDFVYCLECGKSIANCPHCGKQLPGPAKFCGYCGKNVGNSLSKQEEKPRATLIGKTCPFCQMPIKAGVRIEVCPTCKIPHHAECWKENCNKCTTYGCNGKDSGNTQPVMSANSATGYIPIARDDQRCIRIQAAVTGVIEKIFVDRGARVTANNSLLTVKIDKLVHERGESTRTAVWLCKCPVNGYLDQLHVTTGQKISRGQLICIIKQLP